jgi:predicted kinase
MPDPRSAQPIFLVVGGPGAGKSTTSRALAGAFPRSLHLPVDDLRHMVVSGLVLPNPDWDEELVRQIRLAREAAVRIAEAYAAAGFAVVLDDFFDPRGLVEYRDLLERGAIGVVLYPTAEEARRRNAARSTGEEAGYIDAAIGHAYSVLGPAVGRLAEEGWLVLDTTDMEVAAVVAAILERAALRSSPSGGGGGEAPRADGGGPWR